MTDKPIVHILGAGALGSLWATKLSQNNHVVLLVNPNQDSHRISSDSPANLSNRSFQFIEQGQSSVVTLPCEPSSDFSANTSNEMPSIDILLVFTKSYDTLKALQQLQSRLTPLSRIVLFQNGLGSQQEAANLLPSNTIYAATTTEGANRSDPNTVIYAGKGETWVGEISASQTQNTTEINFDLERISTLLSSSGLEVSNTPNIWEKLWIKLAINCAINPFTALLNCKNGELIGKPLFDSLITPLCRELSGAMSLNNVDIMASDLQKAVEDVTQKTANNISSMLQDVRAGKKTEIEYINGYIEKVAQKNNGEYPTNLRLLEEVRHKFQTTR